MKIKEYRLQKNDHPKRGSSGSFPNGRSTPRNSRTNYAINKWLLFLRIHTLLLRSKKGNENYRPYQAVSLVAMEFNICEVAFAVCRDYPDKTHKVMALVRKMVVLEQTTDEDYCSGAAMRRTTRAGKKLSTIDCVGYSVAHRLRIPFLTGDREFEDIDDVEFVR